MVERRGDVRPDPSDAVSDHHLALQGEPNQTELGKVRARVLSEFPDCRLWFDDGLNKGLRLVANPSICYGVLTTKYTNGAGISVYVLGLRDKIDLVRTYGDVIGKASVTGYCIKFRRLSGISTDVLHAAIRHGMAVGHAD